MPILSSLPAHLLYVLLLVTTALALPPVVWDPNAKAFIFIIGGIAIWRYSWGLINWIRFHIYHHITFPKWRKSAEALGVAGLPTHMYLLVTSFRIGTETTRRVYDSVVQEAIHYANKNNLPVTIVASIVERADQFLIKQIYLQAFPPEAVKLVFVRIDGTGKRDALACGFRAISMENPPEGALAAVIDGDSMLPEDSVEKCASLFAVLPKLGALTTDEVCEVDGSWKFREWYNMRFAQRHIFMSSVALSRRVLTLTGRMSMFRCDIICDPAFVERVELDWVDHWRLGRFKFLTGDDKSSWYHILSRGYEMVYVDDVKIVTIETPPDPSFIKSSLVLMRRWFGNMLRTNDRAIRLGPLTTNWFPWISIIDQRLSMWTSLTGITAAILSSLVFSPIYFLYYLWWMLFTRYILTLSLLAGRETVSAAYPFLLYYNQIVGSLVKTFVLFRLDKQKWTRQNTTLNFRSASFKETLRGCGSLYMNLFAYAVFVLSLATLSGIFTLPDLGFWKQTLFGIS
jgi:mannuronan synthase